MKTFLICSATLILFYFGLSFNVSRVRILKRKTGKVTEAQLTKAVRVHGNASEYIPLFIILFIYFSSVGIRWLEPVAIAATIGRIAHAIGMFLAPSASDRHPLRFVGAALTYICGFIFGIVLLLHAFSKLV